MASPLDALPDAKFYACNDPETLTHETPEEALQAWLDDVQSPEADTAALIREWAPVTVTAYRPMEVSDAQIKVWADSLLESLGDMWGDEHANPEEDPSAQLPDDAETVMREAVTKIIRAARVWSCEDVGKVTLGAAQVEAVMREYRPDWFEAPPPAEGETGEGRARRCDECDRWSPPRPGEGAFGRCREHGNVTADHVCGAPGRRIAGGRP